MEPDMTQICQIWKTVTTTPNICLESNYHPCSCFKWSLHDYVLTCLTIQIHLTNRTAPVRSFQPICMGNTTCFVISTTDGCSAWEETPMWWFGGFVLSMYNHRRLDKRLLLDFVNIRLFYWSDASIHAWSYPLFTTLCWEGLKLT